MTAQIAKPWHDGEIRMHKKMGLLEHDNPVASSLTQKAAYSIQSAPLLAVGAIDGEGRPWTTVWGGGPGLGQPLGGSMVGVKTPVDALHDPVVQLLSSPRAGETGTAGPQSNAGKLMGGLIINLDTRKRDKLAGKMVAGAIATLEDDANGEAQAQAQYVFLIEESIGNCPKYLNRKDIRPAATHAKVLSDSPQLSKDAIEVIAKTDLFFVSSTQDYKDMDTNHRGGPIGFVRVTEDQEGSSVIVWPEYSGNRLYQTLGNLEITPLAGLVFPDFETGDVLYVTGKTETLVGKEANAVIPRSNLAVKLTVTAAKLVGEGLPFRGVPVEQSPYNPRLRPLAVEARLEFEPDKSATNSVKLLEQTPLTPTISRFRFSTNNPATYKAGQWVALDFSDELDIGYSHMRNDDPTSINDDFIRTFTVSSPPHPYKDLSDDNFEITARSVGSVTRFMFRQQARNGLEVSMRGFGGSFKIEQESGVTTPFIAGGVGITPVLAFLPSRDMSRFRLFWTLHIDDVNLAIDTVQRHPSLAKASEIYLTGIKDEESAGSKIEPLLHAGVSVQRRRLAKPDLNREDLGSIWHVCVGTGLRKTLLEWLSGKKVIYEDFNF